MSQHNCPLCNQQYTPADGLSPADFLSRGIIEAFSDFQKEENPHYCAVCPRCGVERMTAGITQNAVSRHINCYVCDECGTDEAVRVYENNIMPLSDWWIAKGIIGDIPF
jgi:rubredoxin